MNGVVVAAMWAVVVVGDDAAVHNVVYILNIQLIHLKVLFFTPWIWVNTNCLFMRSISAREKGTTKYMDCSPRSHSLQHTSNLVC